MNNNPNNRRLAFSLNELLIALSVVAIIGAMVVPQYIGLQERAKDVAAAAMADELNHTYANWVAAGGLSGDKAITSDILKTLTGDIGSGITHFTPIIITNPDGTTTTISDPTGTQVTQGGNSSSIKTTLPTGADLSSDAQIIKTDNGYLVYNPTNGQFSVFRTLAEAKSYVAQNLPQSRLPQTIVASASTPNALPGTVINLTASGGYNSYTWTSSDASDTFSNRNGASTAVLLSGNEGTHIFSVVNAAGGNYAQSNIATVAVSATLLPQALNVTPANSSGLTGQTLSFAATGGHNNYNWSSSNPSDTFNTTTAGAVQITFSNNPGMRTITVYNLAGSGYRQSSPAYAYANIVNNVRAYKVTIKLQEGGEQTIMVNNNQTILSACIDEGLDLPFSTGDGADTDAIGKILSGSVNSGSSYLSQDYQDMGYFNYATGYPTSNLVFKLAAEDLF